MSSLEKMLFILDLFTENKTTITIDEITEELKVSIPTGYRYLKVLCDSGLLAKVDGGHYIIGPKIIKLDHQVRKSDPVIKVGKPIMQELGVATGCEVLISNMYNDEVINVHSETPHSTKANISYSRGRPHPLFRGATSIIVLANLPRNRLIKLHKECTEEIANAGLGNDWDEFKNQLAKIRKQGYYISHGQLDQGITGIAAPIFKDHLVSGSLTLVLPTSRFEVFNIDKLISLVTESSNKISEFMSLPVVK